MKIYPQTKDFAASQEAYDLLYDEKYDMLITHPQPADTTPYYKNDSYISHTDSRRGLINKLYQWVKRYSINRKLKLLGPYASVGKSLLDVGAGTGDFVMGASGAGWEAAGVEPVEAARQRAAAKGVYLGSSLQELEGKQFHMITLWHVLEHLPDLDDKLDKLLSMLYEGGTLIIALPNFKSYDARLYGAHWAAYDVPRHLWHFSRNSVSRLFGEKGFQVIRTYPLWFDAFYIALLSEKYKHGKINYLRAFISGLRSNLAASTNKEYSSLIYVLQKAQEAK